MNKLPVNLGGTPRLISEETSSRIHGGLPEDFSVELYDDFLVPHDTHGGVPDQTFTIIHSGTTT